MDDDPYDDAGLTLVRTNHDLRPTRFGRIVGVVILSLGPCAWLLLAWWLLT